MAEEVPVVEEYLEVATLLSHLEDVFQSKQGLPSPRPVDHAIPIIEGSKPSRLRAYRYPVAHQQENGMMVKKKDDS